MGLRKGTRQPVDADWVERAVRYLARWDRSCAQVERFLLAKGATSAQASRAVARLAELGYLDDAAFASRWIERRLARLPMGRERLREELQAQGITESRIDQAIRAIGREWNEVALARQAIQRRGRRMTTPQAWRLLQQRGFDGDTIEQVLGSQREHEGSEA